MTAAGAFLVELVNTREVDTGSDRLSTVDGLRSWMAEQALTGTRPSDADRSAVVELRELLRRALVAHHDQHEDDQALAGVQQVAIGYPCVPRIGADSMFSLTGDGSAAGAVVAAVVGAVLELQHTGRWMRLKVCPASDCLEAFEDETRSGTRRWCSMEACGNRSKVGTYRRRSRS